MHITFPKANLQKAINVLQKVSQNKTSSNLPGAIYMTTKNGQVELQGNDFELGIRLTIDGDIKEPGTLVVGSRYFQELIRKLPGDTIELYKPEDGNSLTITSESIYIISRLIEGTYPEYEKVIPSQFDSSAVIDRREFAGAVDRVSLLAKDISYNVIRYDWSESNVTLSTQNTEIGMAKEDIAVEFKGTPFTISFNGRYISDILRHSTGDNIHLFLKQNGPVVIRQDNNPNYTYVVTPVRTNA